MEFEFPHIFEPELLSGAKFKGDQTRESCQLWKQMGLRVLVLLGTSLSLNPGGQQCAGSSEPKWRRGEELLEPIWWLWQPPLPSCLREPSSQVHTFCNDKTEPQVRKESQSPKGLSTAKCVSKWDVFGKHDASIILDVKSYITSERTKHQFISFRTFCFPPQQLMCTIHNWKLEKDR